MVIINEADSLSRDAQAALRRTMEKYMSNMRIILCANSTSRLIAPIKSRCLLIRVAAPSAEEVFLIFIGRFALDSPSLLDASSIATRLQTRRVRLAARSRRQDHSRFRGELAQGHFGSGGSQDAVVRRIRYALDLLSIFRIDPT